MADQAESGLNPAMLMYYVLEFRVLLQTKKDPPQPEEVNELRRVRSAGS